MKKIVMLVVAVAFAFALTANAAETVKVTETTKGDTTTVKAVEKAPGQKETLKATETGTTVKGTITDKEKKGEVAKETVKFEKYEAQGDYIYVVKDNKVIRAKHALSDSMKKDMLNLKKGDQITVTSTYPLSTEQVATITGLEKQAATAAPAVKATTEAPKAK